jgi:hypothetical protein
MNDMLVPRGSNDAPSDSELRKAWRFRKWWAGHFRLTGERGKNHAMG